MGVFRRNQQRPVYAPKIRISKGEALSVWERYLERGLHAFSKGELEDALLDVEEAIASTRRNGELHAVHGMILLEMGQVDSAMEALDTALKVDDRQWAVHYLRGLHEFRQKHYDTAIEHLAIALRYSPLRPELLYLLGMSYYARGELERARDMVEVAIEHADSMESKAVRPMKKFFTQLKREVKAKEKEK